VNPESLETTGALAEAMREGAANDRAEATEAEAARRLANARALLELPEGIHEGVADEIYHARCLGLASKSALDWFAQSPAYYYAWAHHRVADESTKALAYGRAFHMATLEPDVFARTYVVEPDFGPCRKTADVSSEEAKANKIRRDAWRKDHKGAIPITAVDWKSMTGMSRRLREHKIARPLLAAGRAERMLRWNDPATGLACKAKVDYGLDDLDVAIDLKSCEDASERAFVRSATNYGYDRQHAFYKRGYQALGRGLRRFIFVCCEKTEPYEPGVWDLSAQSVTEAEAEVDAQLAGLAQCIEREVWPGYTDERIGTVTLRRWPK
jgi:hypothetical protein